MIAGLFLFLILPAAMAGIVYVLRHWASLSALLAAGTALALGLMSILLPFDRAVQLWGREIAMGNPVVFLGRELVMTQVDRWAMTLLFLTAAGLFILAWRTTPQGLVFPVGLGLLSLLVGALLIQPLIYAALLVEIAAALSIFALQSEGQPPTQGGLRYLTFSILALPGMMITHWLMDRYALTPDDTGLLNASAISLTISFALLLGSVPFHTWVPAVSGDSEPLAGAFVLTVGNGAIWFLLLDFLETYPVLSSFPRFGSLVSNIGLVMVVVGGLLAPAQRRLGRLMGYGALIDTGSTLIALGMNNQLGVSLALLSLLVRSFGLGLMAAGLKGLQGDNGGDDRFDALRGRGWEAPWSTLALILGGLSIAGMPVSAGFVGRWALYRALSPSSSGAAILIMLAEGGVMIGIWRGLSALLASVQPDGERKALQGGSEGWLTIAVIVLAMAGCIGVGLFPQLLTPTASRLAGVYTFFAP